MGSPAHRAWPEIARPALRALMQRTGETVFLGVLGGDGTAVVFVDKVESEQVIRYAAGVGDRRALHATSSGKVILAFLPAPERERILRALPLKRYTDRTVTSLPALRTALEEVRQSGVCVNLDELALGAAGIAAPIFDRDGRVAGACAIGGPPIGSAPGSSRSPRRCGPPRARSRPSWAGATTGSSPERTSLRGVARPSRLIPRSR